MLDLDKLTKDSYQLYTGLVRHGFTSGMALGLIGNFMQHAYYQSILQDEQEFKTIVKKEASSVN